VQVNQKFADAVVSCYKDGDLSKFQVLKVVWIHDYHLMLVPEMVRKRLPAAAIGFFL
jgi:trehalose-6-phosphate synthase